jgi:AsmA-like protein
MSRRTRRWIVIVAALLLLAFFLPPLITVGLFKKQIQTSMSRALDRQVTIGRTAVRVFPPGFVLENVVIADDPNFSAEPMIRAEEVTASLRLTSLWRGRLEIAKLSLKYPSLNLVRVPDGRWNVEALLQRTSQVSSAPTSKARPETRVRFPYIESDNGRINFKFGNEKKAFALTESDFALWQEAENEWRIRLSARPVRTDMNLSDTGSIKLNARFLRARTMSRTPLEVTASWRDAQLGQVTSLLYGRDRGWRGDLDVNLTLAGVPDLMILSGDARVDNFRRYDIFTTEALRLNLRCTGKYSATSDTISQGQCQVPTSADGVITLRGSVNGVGHNNGYDLSLTADNVPAQQLVSVLRHAKKNVPDDLVASGIVQATFSGQKQNGGTGDWKGGGKTEGVVLKAKSLDQEIVLGNVPFTLTAPQLPSAGARRGQRIPIELLHSPTPLRLAVEPFTLPLGGEVPATANATFSGTDYALNVRGDADITRTFQIARAFGITVPDVVADGKARLDVSVAGEWTGLPAPRPMGMIQLRGMRAEVKGLNAPLQIAGADVRLDPDGIRFENLNASFAGVPMNLIGTVSLPRQCVTPEQCPVTFDLRADQISINAMNKLLMVSKKPWYQILGSNDKGVNLLTRVHAQGRVSAGKFMAGNVAATKFTSTLTLVNGLLSLPDATADMLGGRHKGQYHCDFSGTHPLYSGHGSVTAMNVAQLSSVMKGKWGNGTADVNFSGTFSGHTSAELIASANAVFNFDWKRGELRQVALTGDAPLRFTRFMGEARLRKGVIEFQPSKMQTPRGILEVSGTASLGRQLDMRVHDGSKLFVVSGTLENPKVGAAPTQVSEVR